MCFAVWNYEEKQRVSVDYIMQIIMFLYFKLKFTHHPITVSKFLRTDQLLTSLPHARAFTVKNYVLVLDSYHKNVLLYV